MKAALGTLAMMMAFHLPGQTMGQDGNPFDAALRGVFEQREQDWRNGAVVYQVLVDRFAPSHRLAAKAPLYPAPKQLRRWDERPVKGRYLEDARLWSHEIDFWGGDLASLQGKLGYIAELGAEVLYLNPICLAYTNHKYDALDYHQVSPEYGSRDDVQRLAEQLHGRGMKLVLDGVFNHMGRNAPIFQQAQADPASPWRDWFVFGSQFEGGARTWALAENLPELNLENPAVQDHLWRAEDSVVRSWLRDGVDGWRLDVAFDIGFDHLHALTRSAHAQKPGALVVGEIANYPKEWFPAVDGVMHFTLRHLILRLADGRLDVAAFNRMAGRLLQEADYEHLLKSWLYLDNHDTPRLATTLPDARARRLAQVLQFSLPGSPNLYYGSELDMTGGDDPEMRAPMRWDLVQAGHPALDWTKRLIGLRKAHRALRVGNFRPVSAGQLLAFERHTDRAADTVLVLANPGTTDITETVMPANSKLMDGTRYQDLLPAEPALEQVRGFSGLLPVQVPAQSVRLLVPDVAPPGGYSNYKRVR